MNLSASLTNPSLVLPFQVKSEIGGISGYSVNASYSNRFLV